VVKSSRLVVVLLPSRASSFTFRLEQPAGATDPVAGYCSLGLESRNRFMP